MVSYARIENLSLTKHSVNPKSELDMGRISGSKNASAQQKTKLLLFMRLV